jgi:hypothetical protein
MSAVQDVCGGVDGRDQCSERHGLRECGVLCMPPLNRRVGARQEVQRYLRVLGGIQVGWPNVGSQYRLLWLPGRRRAGGNAQIDNSHP